MRAAHVALATFLAASTTLHCAAPPVAPPPEAQVIESHPGTLVITSPRRAAFLVADPHSDLVEVDGTGATRELTIDGAPVDVASDGSFHAKVHAKPGLNVVVALDGEARLETSFLFGTFYAPTTPIRSAIAIDLGTRGISGVAPDASIESVANLALAGRDLIGAFKGQHFAGEMTAASWTFDVTGGTNGPATVALGSANTGVNVNASINDVIVDGRLSITSLGLTYARDVRITVGHANVVGDVDIRIDRDRGAVTAAMPGAEAKLGGFVVDTDNAGFPCCVDSILTDFIQPKVEEAIREGIRTKVPEALQVTLDGIGVPRKIDFAAAGFAIDMPLITQFDGGGFDRDGGTITASTLFGAPPKAGTRAATAPGFLALGRPYDGTLARAPMLGLSVSVDALNQLMYALWADGTLSYVAPAPLNAKLAPALPPIVSISEEGVLRIGLGEILVQRADSDQPLAAVTVLQDVAPSGTKDSLVLTPKGEPVISVTWLADDSAGSGKNLVAKAAKDQLGAFLKPFAFPLPKLPLDVLGAGLKGQSLTVDSPQFTLDPKTGRIGASGLLRIVK